MQYVWADPHFFHGNILKYCYRDFKDINQMNNALIKYHNEVVKPEDTVYCLGDFAMVRKSDIQKLGPIIDKLNGVQHLILGNHDEGNPFTYVNMGFTSVHTALYVDEFLLIHDPAMSVAVSEEQKVLCGHIHQLSLTVGKNVLNVGVDLWNYRPVSIDYIKENWNSFFSENSFYLNK